jgi:hypothetical protein
VSAFHSRTVLSQLAVASRCPSGLNAPPITRGLWPVMILRVVNRLTRRRTWDPPRIIRQRRHLRSDHIGKRCRADAVLRVDT